MPVATKRMRLRYAGRCGGCGQELPRGTDAHYVPATRTVLCLGCGPGTEPAEPAATSPDVPEAGEADTPGELAELQLRYPAVCVDCDRNLRRGTTAFYDQVARTALCCDCVALDTVHVVGVAGAGARREFERRKARHTYRVKRDHPILGPIALAFYGQPQRVTAWQTGAAGEESFGRRLEGHAGERFLVLHDRRIPGSKANIDHLVVASSGVHVIDAKRYKGRVELRSHGLLSSKPSELYVNGRNQMKLVAGVHRQMAHVLDVTADYAQRFGIDVPPVTGNLCFVDADFGWFASPSTVQDVWVGWGQELRRKLTRDGALPPGHAAALAKTLAATFR